MISILLSMFAAQPTTERPLVVATYAYPDFDRGAALSPLATLVERAAGRPARIALFDTPDALSEAVCAGQVDIAMTNLGSYVTMRDCDGVDPVAVLDTPPAVLDRYRGVLLARSDAGVTSLAELPARQSALHYSEVLPGSTSGALVQAAQLRILGMVPSGFAARRQAGTHDKALDDLLSGRASIAALAENPWRELQAADPARAATLHLLWRSAPLPPGPVVCRNSGTLSCVGIRNALLSGTGAEIARSLAEGWTETKGAARFRPYDESAYAPFKPQ
ncbi:MAG: PhnD/SsuA/transferrin family substrate-binding protein [Sphingopyxis sp.]|uniref:phosphate/phosphite/phosphonate ABC transporter substrate-binding protein n=1 Tax=Sphingopyxis sp. TaxID=1908224 RepID=UPI002ABCA837|nr:PhnD/SsuA/transferrin family substrate-binding protein [Sphingopyxis sp.]MDZ3832311.1 PhnD/SsuA/transferrin family substrate-binding protein [Sphingopyxis sp.]